MKLPFSTEALKGHLTSEFELKIGVCFVENGCLNSKIMEVCFRKWEFENGSLFSKTGNWFRTWESEFDSRRRFQQQWLLSIGPQVDKMASLEDSCKEGSSSSILRLIILPGS